MKEANSEEMQHLIIGTPVVDGIAEEQSSFYYFRITESMAKKERPIYTVLSSKTGDVDLYVKL